MSTVHLRPLDSMRPYCGARPGKRGLLTTATPGAAECARCRKVAGLPKYDPLAALQSMVKVSI